MNNSGLRVTRDQQLNIKLSTGVVAAYVPMSSYMDAFFFGLE